MELKVVCHCGQKYKFDVEPVHGQMPFQVNCPICGADGTELANSILLQSAASAPSVGVVELASMAPAQAVTAPAIGEIPPPRPPVPSSLRINKTEHAAPVAAPPPMSVAASAAPLPSTAARSAVPVPARPVQPRSKPSNNLLLGLLGALMGAGLGVGLMFGFAYLTGFTFPFFGLSIGALSGFGARLLYRGTDMTLGAGAAVIAAVAVVGTLWILFGTFPIMSIISVIVSVSIAFRIAS